MRNVIPVSMPDKLAGRVREVAHRLGLSDQDVIRQTVNLHLMDFCDRMDARIGGRGGLSVWDALKSGAGQELKILPLNEPVEKAVL